MAEKPRASVIIVNWNGAEHLRVCLPCLGSQSFKSPKIIVVDNRSSDDSAAVARSLRVRWLPLEKKTWPRAGAEPTRHVNNDMRFDPGCVAALVEPLEMDEEVFATDGMQFNWDGTVCEHLARA